jgi:hypothetical protein
MARQLIPQQPRCCNCSCETREAYAMWHDNSDYHKPGAVIAAVEREKLTRCGTTGTVTTQGTRSTLWRSVAPIPLLAEPISSSTDAILRMATSTHCGQALTTLNFYAFEDVFDVHSSQLSARSNPHAINERGYQLRFIVSVWAGIVRDTFVILYLLL